MFSMQTASSSVPRLKGLEVELVERGERQVRFDLEVHVWDRGEKIEMLWQYTRELCDRWRMEQMARHYERILQAMVAGMDQSVERCDLLGEEERRRILKEWNDTGREYAGERCVHELFEEQVRKTPGAVAVVFKEQELSYVELNRRANQPPHHLRGLAVSPEDTHANLLREFIVRGVACPA